MRSRTRKAPPVDVPAGGGEAPAARFGGGGLSASAFMTAIAGSKPRQARMGELETAIRSASARAQSGEWVGASGSVMVGLYAMLHKRVYGVDAVELDNATEMKRASGSASRLLRESFNGDADAMVEFVKWAWKREQRRIEWARNAGRDRNRFAWRFLFTKATVVDYQIDQHNAKARGTT